MNRDDHEPSCRGCAIVVVAILALAALVGIDVWQAVAS